MIPKELYKICDELIEANKHLPPRDARDIISERLRHYGIASEELNQLQEYVFRKVM